MSRVGVLARMRVCWIGLLMCSVWHVSRCGVRVQANDAVRVGCLVYHVTCMYVRLRPLLFSFFREGLPSFDIRPPRSSLMHIPTGEVHAGVSQ